MVIVEFLEDEGEVFSHCNTCSWKNYERKLVWVDRLICGIDNGFGLKGASDWSVLGQPK